MEGVQIREAVVRSKLVFWGGIGWKERERSISSEEKQDEGKHTTSNYNFECEWDEITHKTKMDSRMDSKLDSNNMLFTRNSFENEIYT